MGGTLTVLGSHLRRINESDTGRYQNLCGQDRLVCPAGTVVFVHHGLWHGGRRNDSDTTRYMFKIRFNPRVRQQRLWNTSDLDDPQVAEELDSMFPSTEAILPEPAEGAAPVLRQQVLVLYLATSALDSHVVGWSLYDGTGRTSPTTGDSDEPPYESGVAALRAGWRLIQAAQLIPPYPGHEYDVSFLKHEFFFERIVDARAEPQEEGSR